jgi:hemolysin activation/secretion protein
MFMSVGVASAADIPPVYQQSQSVNERQIVVNEFVIDGVTAEDMRARMPELNALVERERQRHLEMDTLDSTDFNDAERAQILAFMQRVAQNGSADANVDEYLGLVEELRQTNTHRAAGLTIDQINAVAASVTDYYRAYGYFLARAVIPAQDVNRGVVTIQVFEGNFGDVVVEGNGSYSDEAIQDVFTDVQGDVITPETIESALVTLQNLPGLEASTSWQPGSEVGSSDLLVSVTEEDDWSAYGLIDNHLPDTTGSTRVMLGLSINNVTTRAGDTLSIGVIQTLNPSDDTFGQVSWRFPLMTQDDSITIGWGEDTFDIGGEFGVLDISGRSTYARVAYDHQMRRSFRQSSRFSVDFSTQRAEIAVGGAIVNEDKLSVFGAQFTYDSVNASNSVVKTGWLRFDLGITNFLGSLSQTDAIGSDILGRPPTRQGVDAGGVVFADSSFSKLSWDYQSARRIGSAFELTFRMQGQYTPDVVSSMQTYTMGGPGSIRGLPAGAFQVDSALVGSLDFGYRPGWIGAPVFSVFYDHGSGYVNDPLIASDAHRAFGSFGWGARYNINGWFVRLMSARMHQGRQFILEADPFADPNEQQYWFDIGSSF